MRKWLIVFFAVLAAIGTTLVLTNPASAEPRHIDYVALGDSYAAGIGAPPYQKFPSGCERGAQSYPHLLADRPSNTRTEVALREATCANATIKNVRESQLNALSTSTDLVTLTVGGNDNGFVETARTCFLGTDAQCIAATEASIQKARTVLVKDLASLYGQIQAKTSTSSQIWAVGYPQLVDPGQGSCGGFPLSTAKREAIIRNINAVDAAIAQATAGTRVRFLDVREEFEGHGACQGKDAWINPPSLASEALHPNFKGYQTYAFAVGYAALVQR